MFDLMMLGIVTFAISAIIDKLSKPYKTVCNGVKKNLHIKILFIVIIILFSLFSGLRTTYNDTETYVQAFKMFNQDINLLMIIEPYGGFNFLQAFLKNCISNYPQIFLLTTSFLVNSLFLSFFIKYTCNFKLTIFSYFVMGPFVFTMAGIKQAIAMSISLIAIDNLLKNRKLFFILFIIIASLFHPYIICLSILPLLTQNIYDYKTIIIFMLGIIVISNIDNLLLLASYIGKDYSMEEFIGHTINPYRVIVELVLVVLSFIGRKSIRRENNKILTLGVNMICVHSLMIMMGLFFNPIYFGRIGTYFSSITAITMPFLLNKVIKNNQNKKTNICLIYLFFFIYFILDLTKLGNISFAQDLFNHVSLGSVF